MHRRDSAISCVGGCLAVCRSGRFSTSTDRRLIPRRSVHDIRRCWPNIPVDIVCLGIGENGHIAFNDPHVARFDDPVRVKVVDLDDKCRRQQVHDGCFASLGQVPTHALTLTIPALTAASGMYCIVPAQTKARAVHDTVYGEITTACPASILRTKTGAKLYLDPASGALL